MGWRGGEGGGGWVVAMAYPNETRERVRERETEGLNSPKMVYYSMLK